MKTIIAPVDFSPASRNASRYAAGMAIQLKAELLLVNIYHIPVAYSSEVPLMLVSVDDLRESSEAQLLEEKRILHEEFGERVVVRTYSSMGNVTDELDTICRSVIPIAVVMGTKGKTGLENLAFGNTTLSVIHHLQWPIVAVPPTKQYGNGIHRIGYACDFREVATTTPAKQLREIVWEFDAELFVLNVDYHEHHFRPETPLESSHLHDLLQDVKPSYYFIEDKNVDDGLCKFAKDRALDLLIMVPKKHHLLQGLFKPANTRQMLFQSEVPVMCLHA